jgi:hypothetical protein
MVDGNRQCGTAHLFLARAATRICAVKNPDPNEFVEVELLKPSQFFSALISGDVVLLSTVCAVNLAMLAQNQGENKPARGRRKFGAIDEAFECASHYYS